MLNLSQESYEEFVEELDRKLSVLPDVMNPKQASSKIFLKLISNLSSKLKNKFILDLGCGSGALSIALARAGAKVIASDINENAIENTKFNIQSESKEVQEKITIKLSDLYKGLEKSVFDLIFFNNPTFEGEPIYVGTNITTFAGAGFRTIKGALSGVPDFLSKRGSAYFLVIESKIKLPKMWTQEHLKENLPKGYNCKKAIEEVTFDNQLGLAYCIYEVYSP